jgi:enoyl-CoA hydratase/carnithine racemase
LLTKARQLRIEENGGVVVVRIERPEVRNAFDRDTLAELTEVAHRYRTRSDIHAVVLAGQPDYFSAGMDLRAVPALQVEKPTTLERRIQLLAGPELCRAWEEMEPITIAAIEGYCIGGSCALALACDFRIVAVGGSLRLPEIPLGSNMPWRTLPRLATMIGAPRAKRFAILGEAVDAQTAFDWGMADEVPQRGEALTCAMAWAEKFSALPPLPVRMTKEAINAASTSGHYVSSFMDRDQYLLTAGSSDFQEGVRAFKEKRKPKFRGD